MDSWKSRRIAGFEELTYAEMIDYLSQEDFGCRTNDARVKSAIDWILFREEERKDLFPDVIERIDFSRCSTSYLKYFYPTYAYRLFHTSEVGAKLFRAVLRSLGVEPRDITVRSTKFLVMGGLHQQNNALNNKICSVDVFRCTVEEVGELPDELLKYHAARCWTTSGLFSVGGSKYLVGGQVSDECFLYDMSEDEWTQLPPILMAVSRASCTVVGQEVYVVGGCEPYNKMHCFNLQTKQWRVCPDLPHRVRYPMVCTVGHELFVFPCNTIEQNQAKITLQCYNTEKHTWITLAAPPAKVKDTWGVCVAAGDYKCLYVVGGRSRLGLRYSINDDTWTELARPSRIHECGTSVLHMEDFLYLCGGSSAHFIEMYDISRNKWSEVQRPLQLLFPLCLPVPATQSK